MSASFRELPWRHAPDGSPRRVGIELEMANLSLAEIAQIVREELGGHIESDGAFLARVMGTELGDIEVELDARVFKDRLYREHLRQLGIELDHDEGEALDRWLADAAGKVVPHEIVTPPVPLGALPRMDRLRAALQKRGARGTHSSLLYAFALQLNIEVHSFDPRWLTPILKAFVLLFDALVKAGDIDLSRQLSPYIRSFPGSYVRHILQPAYEPTITELIDDYLEHNPTRNRPLDMLPLFAAIDLDRVMAAPVERELVKARPAFHYRLPNSEIDDPEWTLARAFNGWAEVEHLAADFDRLEAAAEIYLHRPTQAFGAFRDEWVERIRDWR